MTRTAGLRGRHPAKQGADKFPIGWLHDYLRSPLPPVKLPVDVSAGITDWRMLGNGPDPTLSVNGGRPVGDCTFAGREHYRMAKAGAHSTAKWETADELVTEYLAYDHGRDLGANIADLLLAWYKAGKILAFAPVDHSSPAACDSAMAAFHGLYCGVSLTDNADQLFSERKPWTVGRRNGPDPAEGHCIVKVRSDTRHDTYVTWGALQPATKTWTRACLDEAWVIITTEDSASKIDLARLRADIDALHGTGGGTAGDPTPAAGPAVSVSRTWLVNAVEHVGAVGALAFFGSMAGAGAGWYNLGVLDSAGTAAGAAVLSALEALAANVVSGGSATIPQALRARRAARAAGRVR